MPLEGASSSSPSGVSAAPPSWSWLGRMPFEAAVAVQEEARRSVWAGGAERLLLCEHEPVITAGRSARADNVVASPARLRALGIARAAASRGGDITYHGPGQLVAYPILRLRRGVVDHVENMAAAVVVVLAELGVDARWRRDCPGVWVGAAKICAFGVHVSRRVSIHGLALNLDPDMSHFATIVPCGLADAPVTSVATLRGQAPTPAALAPRLAAALGAAFGRAFREAEPPRRRGMA